MYYAAKENNLLSGSTMSLQIKYFAQRLIWILGRWSKVALEEVQYQPSQIDAVRH